ncbi:hypothetical protein HMPREF9622_01012 [Cutibacterium modestum HL037PA3]|uniref:Uncharacterized protein n=1 Tax=Cutibacterium modestum HL044PA1 TaxID=765109 RepID=A0ABP2K4P6_9ACTN|nr:hypothetical protein HMPREF9621_00627 [Cutibacterium modestum HL037PA2]EFS91876.1 hypothetical protein HMPREF9607_02037 [Cutibacterium modestum HL044PA1]EFT16150.1 hypothetical protein HMPREF9622_01012 [Cutibacterium modestum HL037PA3]
MRSHATAAGDGQTLSGTISGAALSFNYRGFLFVPVKEHR